METRKMNLFLAAITFALTACGSQGSKTKTIAPANTKTTKVVLPVFNADSAYHYVDKQVAFGPRVPNTAAHKACGSYLAQELRRFGARVYLQEEVFEGFEHQWEGINIIGEFFPEKKDRILLCAHWDSRYTADRETNPEGQAQPVTGANDGASGVGVLLEMARIFTTDTPKVGIDIVFFDVEDQGTPFYKRNTSGTDYWCLGSQHWSANPHKPGYRARYGILLDMVGARGSVFRREIYSMQFAKPVVDKVWNEAIEAGFSSWFSFEQGGGILDDHYYLNTIARIPTIDIIQYDAATVHGFGHYWHTLNDDMTNIDVQTLKAVGQTLSNVLFKEPY